MVDDEYQEDVFDYTEDDDLIVKKRRKRRTTNPQKKKVQLDKTGAPKKLSKAVQAMQDRYDAIAADENATQEDWEKFFLSIEKFVMKHAYMVNFKRFIDKDSDLWGHLVYHLLDAIKPKKDLNGNRSCWYIDPYTHKVKEGYNKSKSNIGNFLLNKTKWFIFYFNQHEFEFTSTLTDPSASPIPDEYELPDNDVYSMLPTQIETEGNIDEFRKELERIWNLRLLLA